jgi:hypothetical protein
MVFIPTGPAGDSRSFPNQSGTVPKAANKRKTSEADFPVDIGLERLCNPVQACPEKAAPDQGQ